MADLTDENWAEVCTCLGVASLVADHLQSRQDHALIMVRVQLELCLGIIAKLHKRHLYPDKRDTVREIYVEKKSINQKISLKCW